MGADEVAELDANGVILRRFIPDGTGAMDRRVAQVSAGGEVGWFHTDHQGSVIAPRTKVPNGSGHAVQTASYSPYGELASSGQMPPGLGAGGGVFGYTGRGYDAETGLYQYRARYYHPRLGQFLSTDPIGTKDDPNLTLYVGVDPVNHTDPTGEHRLLRTLVNVGRRTIQNRGNVGRAIREEGASIAGDVATLVGPDSSLIDRGAAAVTWYRQLEPMKLP